MSIASANDREVTAPLHYWQCPSCHKSQQDSVAAYVGDDALFLDWHTHDVEKGCGRAFATTTCEVRVSTEKNRKKL